MPPLLGILASTLLSNGPSMLRAAGSVMGGKSTTIAHSAADFMEALQGKPPIEQRQSLEHYLEHLPPESLRAMESLKVELERIACEREKNQLDHATAIYSQAQETARIEQQYGNAYTKESRPRLARQSFAATAIYILTSEIINQVGQLCGKTIGGADWELATILIGPCVSYIGARTFDKIKGAAK